MCINSDTPQKIDFKGIIEEFAEQKFRNKPKSISFNNGPTSFYLFTVQCLNASLSVQNLQSIS